MAVRYTKALECPEIFNVEKHVLNQKKDIALEALRGMAALSVVLGHSWITFYDPKAFSIPMLLHILVNGAGAVSFFFVLSGYVLTKRFVETENYRSLANSVLKRWFRLLGPVAVSFLLSAVLFKLALYHYMEVADYFNSPWLRQFGYAIPDNIGFQPSFHDAFIQGAFYVFFYPGHQYYNSPTGTIYFESMGSFLIFGLAFLAVLVRKIHFWLAIVLLVGAAVIASGYSANYVAFIAGLGMTLVLDRKDWPAPLAATSIGIAVALYFLSFEIVSGPYAWLSFLGNGPDRNEYVWIAAAVLLIISVERNAPVRKLLSSRVGAFLGRLSFPIYLVHFLVMCSLGCWTWLALLHSHGRTAAMLAIPVTLIGSVIVALPLISFDRWWTASVNRVAASIIPTKKAGPRYV